MRFVLHSQYQSYSSPHPQSHRRRRGRGLVRFATTSNSDSQTLTSGQKDDIQSTDNNPKNVGIDIEHHQSPQHHPVNGGSRSSRSWKGPPSPPPDPSTFPLWSYEPRPFFRFEILHQSAKSLARVGRIHTPHGIIDTPSYVAVATNGALKGVDFRDADSANQQLIFCNTYHLLLQPGAEVVEGAGGLHEFVNRRDRPLITDSG